MSVLAGNPALGHITTFGGHPVSCSAALATLEILLTGDWIAGVKRKGALFREHLHHPAIIEIRGKGLYLAVELESAEKAGRFIQSALDAGIVSDGFLFRDSAFRISPPLIISDEEIIETCEVIKGVLDDCIK